MEKKKEYQYKDVLTMKIEVTLVGTALDAEKYRRSILAIQNNLDSVAVSRVKAVEAEKK